MKNLNTVILRLAELGRAKRIETNKKISQLPEPPSPAHCETLPTAPQKGQTKAADQESV